MTIGGLQKLTLLDFPSRTACTVFLAGCNLCCPYCHNPGLVVPDEAAESLPEGELLRFLSSRIGKLDGVCVLMNGDTPYEFRTTICKGLHTAREIRAIGEWLRDAKRYFLQPFEDSGRILRKGIQPPSHEELYTYRQILLPCIPNTYIRGVYN